MNGVLWGAAIILAVAFLFSGMLKVVKSRADLKRMGMGWTEDFNEWQLKVIGALEVAAAIGLILPPILDIAVILAPLAASGLLILMIGAAWTHIKREESHLLVINAMLMILEIVVIWGRFGPYPFG